MDKKKIQLFTSMGNLERVNERFAKVKIRIAYAGKNRNGTYISKETFEKAIPTLKFCPVVGYVCDDGEFDGHTEKIEIIGDEWNFKSMTQPYGVVTDEKPFWEDVETTNGEIKSYLTCYAMLWIARYPELETIKETDYSQSMEIICDNGFYREDDGLYHIEDMTFDALCILQKKEPCFEDSTISLNFSKEKFEEEYKLMLTELKEFTFSLLEEGGDSMEETTKLETKEIEQEPIKTEEAEEVTQDESVECGQANEEETDFEAKYNEVVTELNELKVKYVDLESNYNLLNNEVIELRQYKTDIEFEQHKVEVDEILAKYSELEAIDGYSELVKEKYTIDIEELEKEIKIFAFDNGITLNKKNVKKSFSKETVKVPLLNNKKHDEIVIDPYNGILDKYIKN